MSFLAHSLQLSAKGPVVLASASPRRAELLSKIGLSFNVIASDVDEEFRNNETPVAHVKRLALAKASRVAATITQGIIIGADTIVVLDGNILGKPQDVDEARNMLSLLSGNTHYVYTGFAILEQQRRRSIVDFEKTSVHFRDLTNDEIDGYVQTGSPMDKAGAYGIQDISAIFVDRIDGCFYNVVGFPLAKFYLVMKQFLL